MATEKLTCFRVHALWAAAMGTLLVVAAAALWTLFTRDQERQDTDVVYVADQLRKTVDLDRTARLEFQKVTTETLRQLTGSVGRIEGKLGTEERTARNVPDAGLKAKG